MMVHQFNGTMGVGEGDKMYRDTNANYSLDGKRSAPELPEGINERLYEPDVRHALIKNHNVVDSGPMPWEEGDEIIKTRDALLAAQRKRQADELEGARKEVNDKVEAEFELAKQKVDDQIAKEQERVKQFTEEMARVIAERT